MKLTLETTNDKSTLKYDTDIINKRRIIIEVDSDHGTIDEVLQNLIKPALVAWSFSEKTVDNALNLVE